jgi:hypothetical protein
MSRTPIFIFIFSLCSNRTFYKKDNIGLVVLGEDFFMGH